MEIAEMAIIPHLQPYFSNSDANMNVDMAS